MMLNLSNKPIEEIALMIANATQVASEESMELGVYLNCRERGIAIKQLGAVCVVSQSRNSDEIVIYSGFESELDDTFDGNDHYNVPSESMYDKRKLFSLKTQGDLEEIVTYIHQQLFKEMPIDD